MAAVGGGVHESHCSENILEDDGLARFAVQEHNTKENALLEFLRVVKTKQQVVSGTVYYLTIEATDGGQKKLFEAKVWVKPPIAIEGLAMIKMLLKVTGAKQRN
ncbi:cysteine proteinase inhibitor A-like [Rosa rugosa]|uniref:cysteine proteinase inhibitor A-like n=1 Tax=Rosa rugosa TaxID=74645 RepID=UPI002B4020B9|nr:cysteine proteinase inhibitor A-like [Rosa rugosa]